MDTVIYHYNKDGHEVDPKDRDEVFAKKKYCEAGTVCYGLTRAGRLVNPSNRIQKYREKQAMISEESFGHYLNFLLKKDEALLNLANRTKQG